MKLTANLTGATFALSLFAGAAPAEELKFANFMAPTNPSEAGAFLPFAEKVAASTGGEVTVRVYSGGELGAGPAEQYSRAVDGVADLAFGLPGYTASNFPLTLLTELPGVLSEETGTETIWKNIDLFKDEYRRVQLISLWSNAPNLLYTRDTAVRKPSDAVGLKIRVPSRNTGLMVESWGATPVSMPVSEIYNSLQTGVIDGALIDGTATKAFKLGEVANYLTVGMDTTLSPFFIIMNRDSFDALTDEQQQALTQAGEEVSVMANQVQLTEGAKGIEDFSAMDGKEVIRLTDDEAAAFNALSAKARETVVAETEAEGLPAQAVVDALSAK